MVRIRVMRVRMMDRRMKMPMRMLALKCWDVRVRVMQVALPPPHTTAATSQRISPFSSRGLVAPRRRRYSARPRPDPRYSRPASVQGLIESSSHLASGVPAPNKTAEASAAITPGCRNAVGTFK